MMAASKADSTAEMMVGRLAQMKVGKKVVRRVETMAAY